MGTLLSYRQGLEKSVGWVPLQQPLTVIVCLDNGWLLVVWPGP